MICDTPDYELLFERADRRAVDETFCTVVSDPNELGKKKDQSIGMRKEYKDEIAVDLDREKAVRFEEAVRDRYESVRDEESEHTLRIHSTKSH